LKTDAPAAASFDLAGHLAQVKTEIAVLTAQVAQPDPAQFVPIAALTALQGEHAETQNELVALKAELGGGKLDKIVSDALASGKLTPATEAWARDLGKKDIAALSAFIAAAPVVIAPGTTQTSGVSGGNATAALSADEIKVCELLGVSKADYQQTLSANA
jgi:phage I-like protein